MKRNLLATGLFFSLFLNILAQHNIEMLKTEAPFGQTQIVNDSLLPPASLQAEVLNDNVTLTWLPPDNQSGEWLTYADSSLVFLIGFTEQATWQAAARWEPDQLTAFDGEYLTKVDFIPGSDLANYLIRIWQGPDAEELIYQQVVSGVNILEWNEITLDEPVEINTDKELWVGFKIDQPDSLYAMGVDGGPAASGYGDLFLQDSAGWTALSALGADVNWSLRAFVTTSSGPLTELTKTTDRSENTLFPTGYNVYRNGEKLTPTPVDELQYFDNNLESDIYAYGVTAVYDSLESEPATTVVQVGGPILQIQPDSILITLQSIESTTLELLMLNIGEDLLEWTLLDDTEWLTFADSAGLIQPGDTSTLEVIVDATDLPSGFYYALSEFEINNLTNPVYPFVILLDVNGDPILAVAPDSIDFGDVTINTSAAQQIWLENTGTGDLFITDIFSTNDIFTVDETQLFLSPGENAVVNVNFSPTSIGSYEGYLTILSNDTLQSELTVSLSGYGGLAPPLNLQANLDGSVVQLNWLDPSGGPGTWLFYGDGEPGFSIGLTDGGVWQIAARWEPNQLAPYTGEYLVKTRFYVNTSISEYTLKIWAIDSLPVLIYEQSIGLVDTLAWNEVFLNEPLLIDGQTELWIGYEINQEANGFPAGVDDGPGFSWYGDLVSFDGTSWQSLSSYGLDVNWNIEAFISSEQGSIQLPSSSPGGNNLPNDYLTVSEIKYAEKGQRSTRNFLGFNIYRDSLLLNENIWTETSYNDTLVEAGTYSYWVTAAYDEGESGPAGPVTVAIDSLLPVIPEGWKMVVSDIEHSIDIPSEITGHEENDLKAGDFVGVFFAHDRQLILAGMTHWDGSDVNLIAYGDHALTSGKDGFHRGDSLIWKIYRTEDEMEYMAEAVYNEAMPEMDGKFLENGISSLKALKINALGLNDDLFFTDVIVYPNPVENNLIVVGLPQGSSIVIYSAIGTAIYENKFPGSLETIDLSGLNAGIYSLMLIHDSAVSTRFVVKY